MSSTEQECSVNEFLNELATANNVSTVIAATSMIDDDGTLFLFVFGQGLNFTKKMDKGPVNPNQCILFGVQCVDNPTDPTRNWDFMLIMCSFYFVCKKSIAYVTISVHMKMRCKSFYGFSLVKKKSWGPLNVTYSTI